MAVALHPEIAYSFRRTTALLAGSSRIHDAFMLGQIEHLLVAAGASYRARRYSDANSQYREARDVIWEQLFPTIGYDESLVRKTPLMRSLVSYAGEWMNVLPVESSTGGVRPRELVALEPGTPELGLRAAAAGAAISGAAADLDTAATLERRGNPAAAKFFRERADASAPTLASAMAQQVTAGPVAAGPVAGPIAGPIAGPVIIGPSFALSANTAARPFRRSVAAGTVFAEEPLLHTIEIPPAITVAERTYSFSTGDTVRTVAWNAGDAPSIDEMIDVLYTSRTALEVLPDTFVAPSRPADVAAALPHAWFYETTLGMAECHHAMGEWATAENWYLGAARYQYLNAVAEAPYVWSRLATLYLDWGNALYRSGDPAAALPIYEKVLDSSGAAPASELYSIAGLKSGADAARDLIAHLDDPAASTTGPTIAAAILDIWAQLTKIAGGLDFWGHWAANVPIWTFDYLQSVASNFCQLAIGAERDAISFWEKADQGELTRNQLTQNVTQAAAERDAAASQVTAAQAQVNAYVAGEAAARQRATNAGKNATDYASLSRQWTLHQALSAQLGAGDDGNAAELNRLAAQMMSGGRYSISGDRGALVGAEQLAASRLQARYEIDAMQRQAADMAAAAEQAKQERVAAQARTTAAQASLHAASVRLGGALALVAAYDQQRFTPDVWNQLGEKMGSLSQRYLAMALDTAKLMQRAYNFETDSSRAMIKPDYMADTVKGLLGADMLMADIQSFTYDMVTSTAPKPQPVRQTISLAQRYPFVFERDFRTTGRMEFETRLDDFDVLYPGTYAGRIEHIEVSVDGIVPARGISGTLTNAGISQYRVPSALWSGSSGPVKHRVQNREAMVISDHDPRADAILVDSDRRRRRIFEGAGVASSWTLELPRDVNDLDYDAIVDVRLTVSYEARYDPDLRQRVLDDLATRPALYERQRPIPLRWLFPDAMFSFYETGILTFELDPGWFARSERDPQITDLGLLVATTPRARAEAVTLAVTAPGTPVVTVSTAGGGIVDGPALAAAAGGPATGAYRLELTAADNPSWVEDGRLKLDAIDNIAVILGYSFTARV